MVDMLTRTASRGPLAGEYELLSAPPGDHALTVVGAIRALLRPVDKSGAYTFRQFAEKMGTTEYFSMDGHSGKEFIGHMRDTLCDAVAEIIGNSPEMKLANIIDSRLDDAMMGAGSMSKRLLEKGRAGQESHQRDLAALAQAHATIEEADKDEPTIPSPQLREAASPEPEKPSEVMSTILAQVPNLTPAERAQLMAVLQDAN
jgi:hypothetical protein